MIGQTISHYKILEKLGGGGMGVVYKAEDTKLKRTVALKFLPPVFSFDQEAKKRFIQEAQSASSLDHNNICAIHEVGETEDGQIFICMNCYEGETLKKKIERGKIQTDEAVDIIVQATTGLQKAHEKGIIHRDIKPANIFITNDGVVKILDFGLAKLSGQTMMTKMGETVGTIAYMSPEQTRGELVDQRTDIWSLGVVLYEMLTRNLPFKGDYDSAMIYSILNEEPKHLTDFRTDVPKELQQIVSKCLEKNIEYRFKNVDELLSSLRRLQGEKSNILKSSFNQMTQGRIKTKHLALMAAFLIVITVLIFVFILPSSGKLPRLNPDAKIRTVPLPLKDVSYCTLSADGNWIAFGGADERGKWDVYFMNSSGGEVRRITQDSSDNVNVTHISRDGSWILYDRSNLGKSEIAIVPTLGGPTRIVCEGSDPRFDEVNKRIFYFGKGYSSPAGWTHTTSVWSINLDGSHDSMVYVDSSLVGFGGYSTQESFSPSPDGGLIAWARTNRDYSHSIIAIDLASRNETILLPEKAEIGDIFWSYNNFIIFAQYTKNSRNYELWIAAPDGVESLQLTQSSTINELYGILSEDGKKLLYYQTQHSGNIKVLNLETGEIKSITSDDRNRRSARISPDNRFVSYTPGRYGAEIIDRSGEQSIKNFASDEIIYQRLWSPDGKWIAYSSRSEIIGGKDKICVVSPFNTSNVRVVAEMKRCYDLRWLNQDTLTWVANGKNWISSIENASPQKLYDYYSLIYSIQNGKYFLYQSYLKGLEGWWVDTEPQSLSKDGSGTAKKIVESVDAAVAPNGHFMLYISPKGELIKVLLPDGKEEVLPHKISKGSNEDYPKLSISHDGKSVVFIESVSNSKLILWEDPFIWD
jgi:serine/threonine protein kinase